MDLRILNYLEDNFGNLPTEPKLFHPITFRNGKIYIDFSWLGNLRKKNKEFCSIPLEELLKCDHFVYEKTSPSYIRKLMGCYSLKQHFKVARNFDYVEITYNFSRKSDKGKFVKYDYGDLIYSCRILNEGLQIIKSCKENKTVDKLLNKISLGPTLKVLEYIFGSNIKNIDLKDN